MSRTPKINEFKDKHNYDLDCTRCDNCKKFKPGYTKLINSIPRKVRPYCNLGEFYTNKLAICNEWDEK